jgi:uncharacterized protein (DUF305 family)
MTTRTIVLRRALLPAATITTALLLTACGGADEPAATGTPNNPAPAASTAAPSAASAAATAGSGAFNDADVTLVTGMIPHHQQAVQMSELAETRAANAQVKAVAVKVKAAQGPEITQMTQMLKTWGKPVPTADTHGGGGHGSKSMPGMMSDTDMKRLKAASGAAFDKMFLDMMIDHHEGAVEMAKQQQQAGADPQVKALADTIVTTQNAEITQMKQLLSQL